MKNLLLNKLTVLIAVFVLCITIADAQTNTFPSTGATGIGTVTPDASSLLEIKSTSKGILIPRMTKAKRDAIILPATGLLIYQTNSTPGFYYYSGTIWTAVTPMANGWSLTGNSGTSPATNFIGTTDVKPLVFKVNNQKAGYLGTTTNTAFGYQTLNANPSGLYNTASGFQALSVNTTGHDNTANGFWSLASNTAGYYNTATGGYSLYSNSDGIGNTANGISALRFNTHGNDNTATGANALFYNTTGYSNVAVGSNSLFNNTTSPNNVGVGDSALYNQNGYFGDLTAVGSKALYNQNGGFGGNTAIGSNALYSNTAGYYNTANGSYALYSNTEGIENTATGYDALYSNNLGASNTASGTNALYRNTTGERNTAVGSNALYNNFIGDGNTAIGYNAKVSYGDGDHNTLIGYNADILDYGISSSSAFGYNSAITASNQVRIGDATTMSIGGYKAWTNISDGRVKKHIKENVPGLAFINLLKPITYNLDLDAADKIVQRYVIKDKNGKTIQPSQEEMNARKVQQKIVCTGFVAQDVEATAKKIGYDFDGVDAAKNDKDLYGLRYAEFVVPLVKAVQELSVMNDKKDSAIKSLQQQINDLHELIVSIQSSINSQQAATISSASLSQNIPNPFNHTTVINYTLPQTYSSAKLIITDKSGQVLKQMNLGGRGKGSLEINAATLAQGAYNYSLYVDGKLVDNKQMLLMK